VEGEGEPVELPPVDTPEPGEPTAEPTRTARSTATPAPGGETTTKPDGGLCAGAAVMGAIALAAAAVWQRVRG
jgi:hypothetical protein